MPKDTNQFNQPDDFSSSSGQSDSYFSHNDPGDTSEFLLAYSRMNEQQSHEDSAYQSAGGYEADSSYDSAYEFSYTPYTPQNTYQPRSSNFMYEEMARDAQNKKRNATIALIILGVLLVIVLAIIGYFFTKANGQMDKANLGAEAISQTISHVSASDNVVVDLDKALQNPEQIDQNSLNSASQQFESATNELNLAQNSLNTAKEHYSAMSDQQKNVVNALQKSIDGRKNMLAAAQPLLQNFAVQGSMLDQATELYKQILLGDQQVRDVIEKAKEFANGKEAEANKAVEDAANGKKTSESSSESTLTAQAIVDLDNEALKTFEQAQSMLDGLRNSPVQIDLSAVENYLTKKIEAVNLLIETDQAISDKDVETAVVKVDAYNAKDNEVVEAASVLPKTPADLVGAKNANGEQLVKQYTDARKMAAEADAVIREYQQVDVSRSPQTNAPAETKTAAPAQPKQETQQQAQAKQAQPQAQQSATNAA